MLYMTYLLMAATCAAGDGSVGAGRDWRDIATGHVIPGKFYADQPYVVIRKDGAWLCTLTTGERHEGQHGQHVVATISRDQGRTWSELIEIEPPDGPEASWVMPLMTPAGRVYAFYIYNGDRVDTLGDQKGIRADMLGWYVYKYSEDGGETWSQRYRLPVRETACDRTNDWEGRVQIMWGIGKPTIVGDSVFFGFTKLGKYMLDQGEGWFFRSDNILTEPDVEKIRWEMLPEGDHGLRADEFGSVQEEHNLVGLSDGSLYCIYRTTTGYPCHSYSRDGGRTWTRPEHAACTPGGRRIKTPRACPRLWRAANGKYLLWYHNHSGRDFTNRNPAWLAGGIERDGHIYWSQPEILLYDADPQIRMSYPDLIEQDGRYWITETQKEIARVHEIDPTLLEGLWSQGSVRETATRGLVFEHRGGPAAGIDVPRLPNLAEGGGFTFDLRIRFRNLSPGQVIYDARDREGRGVTLTTADDDAVRIVLNDGQTRSAWTSDAGLLRPGEDHHLTAIVDGGPKIITFIVNGLLCDGGEQRQFGWGRFSSEIGDVSGSRKASITPSLQGELHVLRIYDRYLRTSEAVANHLAAR